MSSQKIITNPNVFTCIDIDSGSESDDYQRNTTRKCKYYNKYKKQQQNLVKLGCTYNVLDEFKRLSLTQIPNCIDHQIDLKEQQFQIALEKERAAIIQRNKKRNEELNQKYKAMASEIESKSLIDDDQADKMFEEKLKSRKKAIEDAITLDKKRADAESAEAKAKAEKLQKEADEKAAQTAKDKADKEAADSKSKLEQSAATSAQGLEEYKKHFAKIEHYQKNIRPKLNDPAFSKLCYPHRITLNKSTIQLQFDHPTILVKYTAVFNCLMAMKQKSNDAYEVLLNYLAKVILRLVKKEGIPTPYAIYYLARYSYLLCATVPEFMDYLLGRLMKRCPYLIPQYHDEDNVSLEEGLALRRYGYSDKVKRVRENFSQHLTTQECYLKFYGALCQTVPDPGQPANPYPIKHAWIYLARICNMPLREITPALIISLLDYAGQSLLDAYPHQTPKLFRLMQSVILPNFPKRDPDNSAAISRVGQTLEEYFKTGKVKRVAETVTFEHRK